MKKLKIKEWLQQGEKEFDEKFTYMGRNQADQLDRIWNGRVTIPSMKQFISSRQISLIKMIVDMVEELPAFTSTSDKTMGKVSDEAKVPRYGTNYLERETIIRQLSNLRDEL